MKDNNIDKIFHKGLSERRLTPSSDAWSKIESGLDQDTNVVAMPKSTWAPVWKFAASFIIVGILGWLVLRNDTPTMNTESTMANSNTELAPTTTPEVITAPVQINENSSSTSLVTEQKSTDVASLVKRSQKVTAKLRSSQLVNQSQEIDVPIEIKGHRANEVVHGPTSIQIPNGNQIPSTEIAETLDQPISIKVPGLKLNIKMNPKVKGVNSHDLIASADIKADDNDGILQNIVKVSKPFINIIADRNYNDIASAQH